MTKPSTTGMATARLIAIAIALSVATLPLAAMAQVVAVLAPSAPLRAKITRALKQERVRVVPGTRVGKALRNEQIPLSDADWARVAAKLGVDAYVIANPSPGGGSQLDVVIRSGDAGSIVAEETVSARARPRQLRATLTSALSKRSTTMVAQSPPVPPEPLHEAPPLASTPVIDAPKLDHAATAMPAAPPVPATEPPAPVAARDGEAGTSRKRSAAGESATLVAEHGDDEGSDIFDGAVGKLSTFDVSAEVRELRRTFDYSGGGGRRYLLSFNPVAGARASYFPIRNVGAFAAGEFGAGLETGSYPTGTRELMGGALVRFPTPFGQLGASASYFHHAFLVQDTTNAADPSRLTLPIPNTVYSGARVSVSARVAIVRRVQLSVDAAYRLVASVGDRAAEVRSQAYFPGSSAPYGVDGRAVVSVALTPMFEARAGFDYRRYAYGKLTGTTPDGTTIDASSATDQYMAFSLGLAAVLGPK